MASWLDGRRVCLVLVFLGLLLFCIYSITLKEPKTQFKRINIIDDGDILFDLDNDMNNESLQSLPSRTTEDNTRLWKKLVTKGKSKVDFLQKRLPNSIIIGVRKGGTRALLEFLKIHPKIKACAAEVHFFDNNRNYQLGLDWYREQMPKSLPGDITIEKTPAYFVTDKVPERLYQMSKTVKLIVIVRDPTERAISDYVQVSFKKHGILPSFEKFITKDKAEKVLRTSTSTVQIGVYVEHLRKWLKFFPISQLHFVSGEELTSNPATELQAVEKFLNIEPFIKKEHFYINQTKRFPCFSQYVDSKKRKNSGCLSESKGRSHPSIRDDIRELLHDFYRPYNKEFYKEVGRDFHWP
ncbi:heparan sulfate glucosamine 3-O-sulfotransferase 3B1-like [Oculina patagonica]